MCYKTEEKANFVPDKPGTFQKGLLFLARSGHVHFNREKPILRREGGALGVPPVTEVLDFDDLGRAIRQHGLRNHHSKRSGLRLLEESRTKNALSRC